MNYEYKICKQRSKEIAVEMLDYIKHYSCDRGYGVIFDELNEMFALAECAAKTEKTANKWISLQNAFDHAYRNEAETVKLLAKVIHLR